MTREETLIYRRLTRRGFMGATAAGTLSALVGREPALVSPGRRRAGDGRRGHRVVDGRRHGADGNVRSEALHAVCARRAGRTGAQHVSRDRHRGRSHQVHAGTRTDRERDRSRHRHPHLQRRRSRLHPALAASVSLAHRLHSAAADGDAASRRGDLEDARAEEIPTCPPSSPSDRRSKARGRSAR